MLKLINIAIKSSNRFIFSFKQSFFLLEFVNISFLSFDFIFKLRNLLILLLNNCVDKIVLVFLKNFFDLTKVGLDNISHSAEALKQCLHFLLQCCAEDTCDFRFHRSYHTLDFFLVGSILSDESALEFHDCFDNELELISFRFFFFWKEVVVFENPCDELVEGHK
jgi:hypothetical protein